MNVDINNQQLQRLHYILMSRYLILVSQKRALLQNNSAPSNTHSSTEQQQKKKNNNSKEWKISKCCPISLAAKTLENSWKAAKFVAKFLAPRKILHGDLANDCRHFRSLAHLRRGIPGLGNVNHVKNNCLKFFGLEPA